MKILGLVFSYLSAPLRERNTRLMALLVTFFVTLVGVYSVLFHVIMGHEGQSHSWFTAVYWTLVTMTTLGFGDITFRSDTGRIFSVVVLLSGSTLILVLLPFAFIQFVFVPWMDARQAARAPRSLPEHTAGHIVLTSHGPIEDELIRRAEQSGVPYVLLESVLENALALYDRGYRVMVGDLDDPSTYHAARVEEAALVVATGADTANSNVAFTVREISPHVLIVATANRRASVDLLGLAGADQVLQLGEMLGEALAVRILGPDARSHVIGGYADLLIAEAGVRGTEMVGRTIAEMDLRSRLGVNVIGVWERGAFTLAGPSTRLAATSVLILAGRQAQLATYDRAFSVATTGDRPVVIIGAGRVGRAVGTQLDRARVPYRIVEQRPERIGDRDHYVQGDAADLEVLQEAGIREASSVVISTHDDDINVYLTIYCRKLQPDIQVIARANLDRNVSTLYRAGADAVLSYASAGATAIWNHFRPNETLLVAEGLDVFRVPVPAELVGRSLVEARLREETGCTVVAVARGDSVEGNPSASSALPGDADLVLIGGDDAMDRFRARYPAVKKRRGPRIAGGRRPSPPT